MAGVWRTVACVLAEAGLETLLLQTELPRPAPPPRHLCVITWCQEVTSPGSRQRPDSRGEIMNIVFPTEQRPQSNILFVSIEFQIISSFCPPVPGQFQQTQFFPVLMR